MSSVYKASRMKRNGKLAVKSSPLDNTRFYLFEFFDVAMKQESVLVGVILY